MDFDVKKESEMFDRAAEYYEIYRPSYQKEIIETFVNNAGLNKDSKTYMCFIWQS